MELDLIKIVDLNHRNRSVTNDIENVLRKIEVWHQDSIIGSCTVKETAIWTESIGMVTRQEVQRERVANTRPGYPKSALDTKATTNSKNDKK
jgi:hypothetical protein